MFECIINFSWKNFSLLFKTSVCAISIYTKTYENCTVSYCEIQFGVEPNNDAKLLAYDHTKSGERPVSYKYLCQDIQ